jgi:hypothetical protein
MVIIALPLEHFEGHRPDLVKKHMHLIKSSLPLNPMHRIGTICLMLMCGAREPCPMLAVMVVVAVLVESLRIIILNLDCHRLQV